MALPPARRVIIETRGEDGEWSAYGDTGERTDTDSNQSSPIDDRTGQFEKPFTATLLHVSRDDVPLDDGVSMVPESLPDATNSSVALGLENTSSEDQIRGCDDRALVLSNPESPTAGSPFWPWNDSFFLNDFNPSLEVGSSWSFDPWSQISAQSSVTFPGFTPHHWAGDSPFFQLRAAASSELRSDVTPQHNSLEYVKSGHGWDPSLSLEPLVSSKILAQSLLEDAAQVLTGNSMSDKVSKLPDITDVMDSLLSLLPDSQDHDSFENMTGLVPKDVIFDSPFHIALLFSIANGFAGLRNIPSGAILKMLQKDHQMSSRLFDCLRSCPPALAKSLADNLFRAAVEACDEQAVIIILQTTRNSPNAIDPNEIVCKLEGRLYTPIELAAKFRHLGIVKTLLAANADVNKTHNEDKHSDHGALELAVRKWGTQEAVDIKLVRTLLDCHAEVRVDLVCAAVRWGQPDLLRELVFRLPRESHRYCFESSMLSDSAQYLENSLATQIVKQIFEYCQAENCMLCSGKHQKLMEDTLCHAARKGNVHLVHFLLPHTKNKGPALAAAVRKGSRELIDLLLQNGASVSGSSCCLEKYDIDIYKWASTFDRDDKALFLPVTTPLAEAIRAQERDLVNEFELLGALSSIEQGKEFDAALFAASEAGDCQYIQKLLDQAPDKPTTSLTDPLYIAIRKDKTEVALLLLDAGANVNKKRSWPGPGPALLEALRRKNVTLVQAVLEADVDVNPHRICDLQTPAMEVAGVWGNIPIIEDLIFMGTDIDAGFQTTALTAAVKSRNKGLVDLLLKNGANPSKYAVSGANPLEAAIANADEDMIRLLVSSGANPANDKAFISAIDKSPQAFNALLEIFSIRYPQGKMNFGGELLIKAIEKEDALMLNAMLSAKFDVNSFSKQGDILLTPLGFAIVDRKDMNLELVPKLIDAGGDVNGIVRKPYDRREGRTWGPCEDSGLVSTALIVAVDSRSKQMVDLLLKKGADLHRPARKGFKRTALQEACEIGSYKMVKLLLERGANVNEVPAERYGGTALQLAAGSGSIKIANLLLNHGALVHAGSAKVGGRSAFEAAAEEGCLEMIRVLWDAVSGLGFTPDQIEDAICLAESRGHRGCAEYIASLSTASGYPLS